MPLLLLLYSGLPYFFKIRNCTVRVRTCWIVVLFQTLANLDFPFWIVIHHES